MKNIKHLAGIFLILTAFTFTSCDNEPIDPNIDLDDFENPVNGPAVFKADFNGETWNSTMSQAVISNNLISIGAAKADGSAFSILISGNTTGTYPANQNIVAYTPAGSEYGYWSLNMENESENTGSVVITSINMTNHTISGTFSFKGYWSDTLTTGILPVQFTNGVFTNIPFTTTAPVSNDSFSAKFDGVDFVEDQIDVVQRLADEAPFNPVEISIVGSKNANDDSIGIIVPYNLGVGTFTFDENSEFYGGGAVINGVLYNATSGSITIISKTATRIKGTFSYSAYNFTTNTTKQVTDGTFDVEY